LAIWHSGKLRARQTAEPFYRLCNPFAEFRMVRGLLPGDPPQHVRDAVTGETRDILAAGPMPGIRGILHALSPLSEALPLHGLVALETADAGATWAERWRLTPE
jgi:phosphohistidine phosphatase